MRTLGISFVCLISILLSTTSHATPAAPTCRDLETSLKAARMALVTLLTDPEKRNPAQQKLVAETANQVDAIVAQMVPPAGKEAQFKKMKEAWNAFHTTRKTELVPDILAGKLDKAEKVTSEVQAKRITEILKYCDPTMDLKHDMTEH